MGKKILKIALLIFGLLPVIVIIVYFSAFEPGEKTKELFYIVLFWLAAISILGAFAFYVIDVYKNVNIQKDNKHLWAALLFFGNIVVYPFYWYLHIWCKPRLSS
jgi:hypothetical protein